MSKIITVLLRAVPLRSPKYRTARLFIVGMILGLIALVSVVSTYFVYRYWFPPIQVFRDTDVGREAILETNYGLIEIRLDNRNRFAVAQFTRLSRMGFFDGTRIHRIVPDLLIEGGDPLTKDPANRKFWGEGGSAHAFPNETHPDDRMSEGTFAFSGSAEGTYGSHFMIVTKTTPWLRGKHTILGHVIYGMDTVHTIERLPLEVTGMPGPDVVIYKLTVL